MVRRKRHRRDAIIYRQKHPGRVRTFQLRYSATHSEEKRQKSQIWRAANPERSRLSARIYAATHYEERAQFREAHRDEIHTREHRWRQNNLAKDAAKSRRRHAKKRGAVGKHTYAEFVALCEALAWGCQYCGMLLTPETVTEDHIVPIVRGGDDRITNITLACVSCNSSKGTQLVHEFLESARFQRILKKRLE